MTFFRKGVSSRRSGTLEKLHVLEESKNVTLLEKELSLERGALPESEETFHERGASVFKEEAFPEE